MITNRSSTMMIFLARVFLADKQPAGEHLRVMPVEINHQRELEDETQFEISPTLPERERARRDKDEHDLAKQETQAKANHFSPSELPAVQHGVESVKQRGRLPALAGGCERVLQLQIPNSSGAHLIL